MQPKKSGICKFCKKTKDFVKAHILPQAIIKNLQKETNSKSIIEVNSHNNLKKHIKANGYYDSNILCAECDHKFGYYEEKLLKFLKDPQVNPYNYFNISLAIKIILWKAHMSSLEQYDDINLEEKYINELYKSIFFSLNDISRASQKFVLDINFTICIQHFKNLSAEKNNSKDILANMIKDIHRIHHNIHGTLYILIFYKHRIVIRVGGGFLLSQINKFITLNTPNIQNIYYRSNSESNELTLSQYDAYNIIYF